MTNIRQYRLLSGLYDRAVRLVGEEKFFWHQLSLALICDHRHSRAVKVLNNCLSQTEADFEKFDENTVMEYLHLAKLQIEQLGDMDLGWMDKFGKINFHLDFAAESAIKKAIGLSTGTWLSGRCYLLLAMIIRLI